MVNSNSGGAGSKKRKASQLVHAAIGSFRAGKLQESLRQLSAALAMDDRSVAAWNLKGILHNNLNQFHDAISALTKASELDPKSDAPWVNRAKSRIGLGDANGAAADARRASELNPKNVDAILHLVRALEIGGNVDEALPIVDHAIKRFAANPNLLAAKARLLNASGRLHDAIDLLKLASDLLPSNAPLKLDRATLLLRVGQQKEALAIVEAIIAENPDQPTALFFLGNYHFNYREDRITANEFYRRSLAARFDRHVAASLCFSLINTRGPDEPKFIEEAQAVAARCVDTFGFELGTAKSFSSVFERTCDFSRLARFNMRACAEYWASHDIPGGLHGLLSSVKSRVDRLALVDQHKKWGDAVLRRLKPRPFQRPASRRTSSKVRIGIVSSDLRDHPVAYFALPIFQHFDRERVELYAYSFNPRAADNVQTYIAGRATCFRTILGQSDQSVAEQIAADDLDIVFELGGSTHLSRPKVFAHRVADIQASWLGYPHSLGLSTIDYLLVDPYLKPPADLMLERPFEMPNSWVCIGDVGFNDRNVPAVVPPVVKNGFVTFGTANNPMKYTLDLIALWSRVLNETDGSRFLFIRPEGAVATFRENIKACFAANGVSADRIDFRPVRGQHLPHYSAIDISLDCAPHTGGTTTCESLWMGVPVVTRVGEAFFERISFSNLSNVGLADLCATSDDDYVRVASQLAADVARLSYLRRNLRQMMRNSPLGNAPQWVRDWEDKVIGLVKSAG